MRDTTISSMTTTLARIREHHPCTTGWKVLCKHLGPDWPENRPIPLISILESNGWREAVWVLRAVDGIDQQIRLFVCDCAEQMLPKFEQQYPNYQVPRQVIEVSRRFAKGEATIEELKAVQTTTYATSVTADAAYAGYVADTTEIADVVYISATASATDAGAIAGYAASAAYTDANVEHLFRKYFTT